MRYTSESLIADYNASGLTQKEFCRRQSISFSTFQYHLKKIRNAKPAQVPSFLPLIPRPSPQPKRIIIIEGVDLQDLRKILVDLDS